VNHIETQLQWAKSQFSLIAVELVKNSFNQVSDTTVRLVEDPHGEREITVEFHGDLPDPWIKVVDAPKKGLLPNLSGQEPEPTRVGRFDAVQVGTTFHWIENGGDDGILAFGDVVKRILEFTRSAV
jgi:hypothetical protein